MCILYDRNVLTFMQLNIPVKFVTATVMLFSALRITCSTCNGSSCVTGYEFCNSPITYKRR